MHFYILYTRYVCCSESAARCPIGWDHHGNSCYLFSKDTQSWNSSSVCFCCCFRGYFFITAQSFYYFTYFQFVSSNLNTQQIIHIVLKTVRRYCIGYRSTFINFISIPTIICFNLNDGGNACVRYITNVTFMMLTTMSSSIT